MSQYNQLAVKTNLVQKKPSFLVTMHNLINYTVHTIMTKVVVLFKILVATTIQSHYCSIDHKL